MPGNARINGGSSIRSPDHLTPGDVVKNLLFAAAAIVVGAWVSDAEFERLFLEDLGGAYAIDRPRSCRCHNGSRGSGSLDTRAPEI